MDDHDARLRDLQQQLHQLDREARGSALTPGEAEKNRDQRDALLAELRDLGGPDADTPAQGASPPAQG